MRGSLSRWTEQAIVGPVVKLGIIGVGHLAHSILKGMLRAGFEPSGITLSPRGKGPDLAKTHGFRLATDNAVLVQGCDIVLLAVRPADAAQAVHGLPWHQDQILVSACAGVPISVLQAGPAQVVRIMPITAAELEASPTAVYPMVPRIAPLLEAIGTAIPLTDEAQFETATVSAAIYGWVQALIKAGVDWSARHGLEPDIARQIVARTFTAAGRMQAEQDAPMDQILDSLCTPGGITEAGLNHLNNRDQLQAWEEACDLVLRKLKT